jgi:hypothetical protein
MNKPVLGMTIGGVLGLFDGLSAWGFPEARTMMAGIIAGSVIKGIVTGLAVGVLVRRRRSVLLGVTTGLVVGAVLSTGAAVGQPDHYWAIVLPGMLLGAIVGYVTPRYGSGKESVLSSNVPVLMLALVLMSAAGHGVAAQTLVPSADLTVLEFFLGRWSGTAEGQPGKGTVSREYATLLRSKIIQSKHQGVYPPQPANPKGEVHEDTGIYSFDTNTKRIRFRQFHVEGFVVHYVLEPQSTPGTFVFVSEAIENIPVGYRSRETHVVLSPDEFEEVFELAEPGKDFQMYSRTKLSRMK